MINYKNTRRPPASPNWNHASLCPLPPFPENFIQIPLITFRVIPVANKQRDADAGCHVNSLAEVITPQQHNAQELNQDLLRVLFLFAVIRFDYDLWQPQLISTLFRSLQGCPRNCLFLHGQKHPGIIWQRVERVQWNQLDFHLATGNSGIRAD